MKNNNKTKVWSKLFAFILPALFAVANSYSQYCTPTYSYLCSSSDYINNFSTTGGASNITNNASGCNGNANNYIYNSGMTCSQVQGQSITMSMQSGSYGQGFRIWIDWNADGDFADIDEDVLGFASGTAVVSGSITVPFTATPGTTRMRVMCRYATNPLTTDYCATTLTFGEVEDYNFTVVGSTPCSGTPTAGTAIVSASPVCPSVSTTLSLTGATLAAGLTYQWQSSTDNVTFNNITGATSASYATTVAADTYFRCVVTCTSGGATSTSSSVVVVVNSFVNCYCVTPISTANDEEITNVTIDASSNSSTCATTGTGPTSVLNKYSDYTTGTGAPTAFQITKCIPTPMSVTVGSCGTYPYSSGLAIFIDLNHNGSFADAGEKVYSNGAAANILCIPASTVTGNIVIPSTALDGLTRMRVISAEYTAGNSITPCGAYSYGEVEDYMINILPAGTCPAIGQISLLDVTNESAVIQWNVGCNQSVDYDIQYGPVGSTNIISLDNELVTVTNGIASYTLNNLTQNTDYNVTLHADCGNGDTSNNLSLNFFVYSNCKNPFGMTLSSDVDSIFGAWQWQSWDSTLYQTTGFTLQYDFAGFTNGTGTFYSVDNNLTDTIVNPALLGGGVYQVYVQAVCGVDSSQFVGPFNVTMPVSNDSVCGAEWLTVNGPSYVFNNTGASVQPNEVNIVPPVTGAQTTTGWIASTLNGTTWFKFVAPTSGNMRINSTSSTTAWNNYNGQVAVYSNTNGCSDFANFTLNSANDNAIGGTSVAPNYTICGLTPGATYYIMFDGSGTAGTYALKLTSIDLEAGSAGNVVDVCAGESVNLFDAITGYQPNGVWTAQLASAATGLEDSTFQTDGLAFQTFNFQYRVTDGCAYDSIIGKVKIFAPSSAGSDGTVSVCRNEPFNLFAGLGGNADMGGQWLNPSNAVIATPSIFSSNIPGQYNYTYISGNGVCPNDTANVLVDVAQGCNYLSVDQIAVDNISLYPNPSNGLVYVSNEGSSVVYNYTITDAQGRVIANANNAIKGAAKTEINLQGKETGIYMIRVFNENSEKVFRVVLQ
jgi:hypothetical protein